MRYLAVLAIGFLSLTSCGGSDDNTGGDTGGDTGTFTATYYCDYSSTQQTCWGWTQPDVPVGTDVTVAWASACSQGGGAAVSSCPTTGALGKCTVVVTGDSAFTEVIYFYEGIGTVEDAAYGCSVMNMPESGMTATWSTTVP